MFAIPPAAKGVLELLLINTRLLSVLPLFEFPAEIYEEFTLPFIIIALLLEFPFSEIPP